MKKWAYSKNNRSSGIPSEDMQQGSNETDTSSESTDATVTLPATSEKKKFYWMVFILVLTTLAAYGPLPWNKFVIYDDPAYITENIHIHDGLTYRGIVWAFTSTYEANWHPLTWLSHMLDVQLYGLNPAGHHITSLLLHLGNTVLLFATLRRMTGALWRSGLVALLFAIHPLHVESVAWGSERKDLLCALFWLVTLQAYLFYVQKPGWKRYLLLMISFTLGLMTKPMLVTLPCALLLLDYWPLHRKSGLKALIGEKVPLLLLSAGSSMITYRAQIDWNGTAQLLNQQTVTNNVSNALQAYVGYLAKTLWPAKLAVLYMFDETGLTPLRTGGAALILLAVTLLVLVKVRRFPYMAVGWFWYMGTLVPVIGIVKVGYQSMADRYTYLPHIGLFIIVSWGLADLVRDNAVARRITAGVTIIVAGILGSLTFQQVNRWQNTITLMEHTVAVTENNWLAYNNLAAAYILIGTNNNRVNIAASLPLEPPTPERRAEYLRLAIEACSASLRIKPYYLNTNNNLKLATLALGDVERELRIGQ